VSGTILRTPSLGNSDWSSWITQQGATDTGYMRVSLTNFATTAASAIATGGVLECAGSIYTFTETAISLASGTASADVAVYYTVIPSAGGTTVTVAMDSTVPVWVDAKQGFYLSAASLTRAIGGCYIGTASTYYSKYLYTGENLVYCLQTGETRTLLEKVLEIGDWDMDTGVTKNVTHGISNNIKNIRSIRTIIRNDADTHYYPLEKVANAPDPDLLAGGINDIDVGNITLLKRTGGFFDDANFVTSPGGNRGWIYIKYRA